MSDIPVRSFFPREVAARWRCRVATVRAMIKRGELAAFELNGSVRVPPEAILRVESEQLAVRPARRRKREAVPREVADMLAD